MRRRDFVAGFAGSAAVLPLARAQQAERVRRIGVLPGGSDRDARSQPNVDAFRQALQELGVDRRPERAD